jgi:hypothetical protein
MQYRTSQCSRVVVFVILTLALSVACNKTGSTARPQPVVGAFSRPSTSSTTTPVATDARALASLRALTELPFRSPSDDEVLQALRDVGQSISDDQLTTVEQFALTDEAIAIRWLLARLLVERGRFDAAANVIVTGLLPEQANRKYMMWKWWEYSFRARPDFADLSERIAHALIQQFAEGTVERRQVVADLFNLGATGPHMTVPEFRRAVMGDARR